VPSFFEWQVTLFIVALGTGLFYLGYRFLPLTCPSTAPTPANP
jgi:Ni/Fe-hydrogenase subunit HybB-like protein